MFSCRQWRNVFMVSVIASPVWKAADGQRIQVAQKSICQKRDNSPREYKTIIDSHDWRSAKVLADA